MIDENAQIEMLKEIKRFMDDPDYLQKKKAEMTEELAKAGVDASTYGVGWVKMDGTSLKHVPHAEMQDNMRYESSHEIIDQSLIDIRNDIKHLEKMIVAFRDICIQALGDKL